MVQKTVAKIFKIYDKKIVRNKTKSTVEARWCAKESGFTSQSLEDTKGFEIEETNDQI